MLAAVIVLVLQTSRVAPAPTARLLRAGINVAVKQGTELGGWILVCFGAIALARAAHAISNPK